jgi:predicted signal transduction protein with EAL and GGDEF domain
VIDALGEAGGDAILSSVATRLEQSLTGEGVVERVGDDEFALLVATRGRASSTASVCERVLDELRRPFDVGARSVRLTASLGAVSHAPDADSMLRRAQLALAQAKASGGSVYRLFGPQLEREHTARRDLQARLARALDHGELELRYQAIHALPDLRVSAAKALLRWEHEARVLAPPHEMVAAAHAARFGMDLESWVIRSACREAAGWPAVAGRAPRVSVNLSAPLFARAELPAQVERALGDSGLDPARLDLELTEESLLRECDETARNVKRLSQMGVGLVLDDFGTRYANFGYLASLPVTRLKIDRSFVGASLGGPGRPLLRALLALARGLGIPAVSEGVEDAAQLEFVARHGCAEAQGFHLGGVLPAAALRERLSRGRAAS